MSYRLIDHEPEGRTDKVSAMRGTPSPRRDFRSLALFGLGSMSDLSPQCASKRTSGEST